MAELLARAQEMRGYALERLERLVTADSPSNEPELLQAIQRDLADGYVATGARAEHVDGDHLVCHWPATSSSPEDVGHVLLIGHSDTVFPRGTPARRPFRLAPDGDTVTGPGVYDMKGALVAVELAMLLLARAGRSPSRPVRLVVVSDEETGSPDGQRVVAAHAEGAVAALGLEPPLPGGGLKVGRRGVARVELVVEGVEAHAGLDAAQGVSAVDELVDQLVALRAVRPGPPEAELNVGTITGGTRANVVAGQARAEVGLRFSTVEAERSLLTALESARPVRAGATIRTRRLSHRPVWTADPANPVAARLVASASAMGLRLSTGFSGGAGDTNLTGARGVPTVDGLGPDGGGAHAVHEYASVASLLQRAALLADYLS
jgi:glutamate carboxypeptidase